MKKCYILILAFILLLFVSCTSQTNTPEISNDVTLDSVTEQINYANTELIKGLIHIKTTSYNHNIIGQITNFSVKTGSGVIFHEDELYYYYLSNNHVIYKEDGFTNVGYEGVDCYGSNYKSTLLFNDPEYDLSILRIKKINNKLHVFPLSNEPLESGDILLSMGHPNNIINVVTIGKFSEYRNVVIPDSNKLISDVKFPVLCHTCPTDGGNSGGALINLNYELVGINYANLKNNDDFVFSFSIPIEKVKEFLNKTIFKDTNNE